jgi:hypothetical protein
MSEVTVALAQRSRWQAFTSDSSNRFGLMMFEDAPTPEERSNLDFLVGRQSLAGRADSSNANVIKNPSPMAGVIERNPAKRESPDKNTSDG